MCMVRFPTPLFRLCSSSKATQSAGSSEDMQSPMRVSAIGREMADANAMTWSRGMVGPPSKAGWQILRSVTDVSDVMRAQALLGREQNCRMSLLMFGSAAASSSKVLSVIGHLLSARLTRLDRGANENMMPAVDIAAAELNHSKSFSG